MRRVLGGQIIIRTMDLMPSNGNSGRTGGTRQTTQLCGRDIRRLLVIIIERTVQRRGATMRSLRIIISPDWRRKDSMMKRTRRIASQTRVRTSMRNLRRANQQVGGMINLNNLKMDHFLKSKEEFFIQNK